MKNAKKGKSKTSVKTSAKDSTRASTKSSSKLMKAKVHKKSAVPKASGKKEATHRDDIIKLILDDHKPVKKLIKTLKNNKLSVDERQNAFAEFTPLFVIHAKSEEQTLYVFMKEGSDLREEGFEGSVEHNLATQLIQEIQRSDDDNVWAARVKVLAELVEHHIEEEEEEMLPAFRKHSDLEERIQLGQSYLSLKAELEARSARGTLSEEESMEIHPNH